MSNVTFSLPAGVELDVRVEEAHHRRRGRVPAVDSGSDQALPLAVPHDLHQTWVTLVDVLVQVEFQFHCKRADHKRALETTVSVRAVRLPPAREKVLEEFRPKLHFRALGIIVPPKTILCFSSLEILHF